MHILSLIILNVSFSLSQNFHKYILSLGMQKQEKQKLTNSSWKVCKAMCTSIVSFIGDSVEELN